MRCPWYIFHRLFRVWARTQGPHDPLLPGGPHELSVRPCWCLRSEHSQDKSIPSSVLHHHLPLFG
ncbi:unnamed protein product [Staurois parvus]|uniref:Uncharacterized protein n=1 Tax=Staurois parvus TaxID=386267 RepID=A0ABN9APV3_9NEOB|nr:unnamed protein product [Staurois parvus]